MENLELELKLTVAHVNAILKHLAAGAYAEVADVIALLHGQAQPQMQAAAADAVAAAPVAAAPAASATVAPAAPVGAPGKMAADYEDEAAGQYRMPPTGKRRTAPAAAPAAPKGEPQIVLDSRAQRPMPEPAGIEALAATKQQAPSFGLPEALTKMQDVTKSYTDQQAELIKSLTPSAEEKEKQGNERKAIMALKAAGEFLKPGVPGTAARLGNIGSGIADLATQYGKEDREEKRALIAGQISLLGSQAQLAQGNAKAAVDLFQHGEKMALQYATLEADKEYKRVMASLEGSKLTESQRHNKAQEAADNRKLDIMTPYYNSEAAKNLAIAARDPDARWESIERSKTEQAQITAANNVLKDPTASLKDKQNARNFLSSVFAGKNPVAPNPFQMKEPPKDRPVYE